MIKSVLRVQTMATIRASPPQTSKQEDGSNGCSNGSANETSLPVYAWRFSPCLPAHACTIKILRPGATHYSQ